MIYVPAHRSLSLFLECLDPDPKLKIRIPGYLWPSGLVPMAPHSIRHPWFCLILAVLNLVYYNYDMYE